MAIDKPREFELPTPDQVSDMAIDLGLLRGQPVTFRAIDVVFQRGPHAVIWPSHEISDLSSPVTISGTPISISTREIKPYFTSPFGRIVTLEKVTVTNTEGEILESDSTTIAVRLDGVDPSSIQPAKDR